MKLNVWLKMSGLIVLTVAVYLAPQLWSTHWTSSTTAVSSGDAWLTRLSGGHVYSYDRTASLLPAELLDFDGFESFLQTLHLAAIQPTYTCFSRGTPEEQEAILRKYSDLGNPRPTDPLAFFSGSSWTPVGEGTTLTWSLVPDGTFIPGSGAAPSNMFAVFDAQFAGVGGRAKWISLVEQFLGRWTELNGNTYVRITLPGVDWDDGASFSGSPGSSTRGDIRISGRSIDGATGSNVLAFNFFPTNGDMVIDTDNNWSNSANNFRFLRNVLMHEHGHGIGLAHVCSTNSKQLMEPFIDTSFDGVQHDDVRGGHRQHGDPFEPDNTVAQATDLGTLNIGDSIVVGTVPSPSISSTDNLSIDDDDEEDWFQFTVVEEVGVTISAIPRGLTYDNSQQFGDGSCDSGNPFDSTATADLNLKLFAASGFVCASGDDLGTVCSSDTDCLPNDRCLGGSEDGVLCTAAVECPGGTCGGVCGVPLEESDLPIGLREDLTDVRLPVAGTYFVRVGERPDDDISGETQLYRFTINVTTPPAAKPPVAAIDPFGFPKDRYITFDPSANGITPIAIRVTVPGGGFKYVGNVQDLGSAGFFAELIATAEFRVWPETVLHVRGCEFAPGNAYVVESTLDDIEFSTQFMAVTTAVPAPREFGDVVGSFNGVDWAAPDGIVTTNDILAAVLNFQLNPIAPHKARVDLVPKVANTIIASDDILAVVRGFASDPYFFGTDCSTGTCIPSCP